MITKQHLAHVYYRAFPKRRGEPGLDSWFFFGEVKDIDWGALATTNATEHLAQCFDAMEAMEATAVGEDVDAIEDPSSAPFCGCDICVTRETIYAVWGTIAQATLAGVEVVYDHQDS